jgi:hypothetical protein
MKRATRTNLILIGIVAALGFAVYSQVGHEIAEFEPPLTALDPGSIDQIAVSCTQCVPRRFVRDKQHWTMQAPYAMAADDDAVNRLLSIAASPVRLRHPGSAFDAKKIGLDPPLMTLELGALDIDIGMTDVLRGDRYVRIGDTIAMAPDRFSPFLAATPESELDRHLVPRDAKLVELHIDGISHPELIAAWSDSIAARIRRIDSEARTPAPIHVELKLGNGETVSYRFGRVEQGYIALRETPALAYALSETAARTLLGDAAAATN